MLPNFQLLYPKRTSFAGGRNFKKNVARLISSENTETTFSMMTRLGKGVWKTSLAKR